MPRRCSFKLELDFRSRSPASTRRAARRWPGRWSPRPASSTATNSRAGSTIARTCRSTSARRSTAGWSRCAAWGVGIATVEEIDQHQHLLGADAGDDPRGRGAGARAGLGAGRRQRLSQAGSGRRRRSSTATPSAARSPPPRSSPRSRATGSWPTMRANIRATAGSITAAIRPPITAARCTRSGRPRCTAEASAWCAKSRPRGPAGAGFRRNRAGESFAPHHQPLESGNRRLTQYLVAEPSLCRLAVASRIGPLTLDRLTASPA